MCYDEGIFQEIIDGEYEGNLEEVKEHIANCVTCKRKFEELQKTETFISKKLDAGFRTSEMRRIDVEYQLFKFYKKEKGRKYMNSKAKKLAAVAATLTIIMGTMASEPVRVRASELLNVFRVNEVTGISVTDDNMYKLEAAFEKGEGSVDFKDFVSAGVKSKEESVKISKTDISKEAVKKYKQDAELIPINDSLEYDYMTIHPESDLTFKFNVTKANDFLEYLGEDVKLPKEIDQKEFQIHTGKYIYYNIHPKKEDKSNNKYISVTQIGTPTLTLPEGVSQKQMVDVLLSLKLLPQNIKDQLANIEDLTTTLPIPYMKEHQTKLDITINGQKAVLIENKDLEDKYCTVIFKKGDSLFNVDAKGYSSQEVTALLEAME